MPRPKHPEHSQREVETRVADPGGGERGADLAGAGPQLQEQVARIEAGDLQEGPGHGPGRRPGKAGAAVELQSLEIERGGSGPQGRCPLMNRSGDPPGGGFPVNFCNGWIDEGSLPYPATTRQLWGSEHGLG